MHLRFAVVALLAAGTLGACATAPARHYDVIISGGAVYDGSGAAPIHADVAIEDDRIAAIGDLARAGADTRIDAAGTKARGAALAPGTDETCGTVAAILPRPPPRVKYRDVEVVAQFAGRA